MWRSIDLIREERNRNWSNFCLAKITASKWVLDFIWREAIVIKAELVSWTNLIRVDGKSKFYIENHSLNWDVTGCSEAEKIEFSRSLIVKKKFVRWELKETKGF